MLSMEEASRGPCHFPASHPAAGRRCVATARRVLSEGARAQPGAVRAENAGTGPGPGRHGQHSEVGLGCGTPSVLGEQRPHAGGPRWQKSARSSSTRPPPGRAAPSSGKRGGGAGLWAPLRVLALHPVLPHPQPPWVQILHFAHSSFSGPFCSSPHRH